MATTVIFALGTSTPLFPLLVGLVPGLGWLRVPPRAWVLVAFCLALLAGRGLDALTGAGLDEGAGRRITLVALIALVAGLTLAVGLLVLFRPAPPAAWSLAALTVLACTALILRGRDLLGRVPLTIVFLLLIAADLTLVRAAWTEMRSPGEAFAWGAEPAEALVSHSQNGNGQQPGWFRTYSPDYSLPQHTAIRYGLYLADGTDPIQLTHYASFLATAGGYAASGYSPTLPPDLDDRSARPDAFRLGLLNVEYVAAGFPLPGGDLIAWEKAGDTYIYRNEQVMPRAFVVSGEARPESGTDVSLPRPLEAQPASISTYTPNRIVVETDLQHPGLLVLSEVWYPGWQARDGGRELPIYHVEGVLRGVYLAAGTHTIEFRYAPWSAWLGLALSGSATLGLLGYAAIQIWRRR
jgi:hypothetical protein